MRDDVLAAFSGRTRGEERLSRETVFEVLRNARRRYAIHCLKRAEGPVSVDVLVDRIAAWENDTTVADLSAEERQRVHVSLLQTHLPMMASSGVIDFDRDRRLVELSEAATHFDIYLESVTDDINWSEYYLGVTALNAVLLELAWLDIYPFGFVADVVWAVFVVTVFLVAALLHTHYDRRTRLGTAPPVG